MSADKMLSKAQTSKKIQSYGFLSQLLSKIAGPLMKVVVPIAKKNLGPIGITAAASSVDLGIQEKMQGSGTATLVISVREMNDIMKIVQALEDSNVLLKGITKTIENQAKEQKGGFLGMLLCTLRTSFLRNYVNRKRNKKSWLWK